MADTIMISQRWPTELKQRAAEHARAHDTTVTELTVTALAVALDQWQAAPKPAPARERPPKRERVGTDAPTAGAPCPQCAGTIRPSGGKLRCSQTARHAWPI